MKPRSFISYLADSKSEYRYTLKFAVDEVNDGMIDALELALKKYNLLSASAFRKTPIQSSPLDFPNVRNTSVFICDVAMGYPASLDFLRTYIGNTLGMSTALIAVYSENDPRQVETDLHLDRTSPEFKASYKPVLGAEYEPTEAPKYGDTYNTSFLKELEKVRKEREQVVVENPLSVKASVNHSDLPKDYQTGAVAPTAEVGMFGRIKKYTEVK